MPRKDFLRDLERARSPGLFPGLHGIRLGDDDESISFSFSHSPETDLPLEFQVVISDLSEYPKSHQYLIFSTSTTVPPAAVDVLDVVRVAVAGSPIHDLFNMVSDALRNVLSADILQTTEVSQDSENDEVDWDAADSDFSVEAAWQDDSFDEDQQFFGSVRTDTKKSESLKQDLRAAKKAGFKVGYLGKLTGSVIISISCRVSKLGISDEAMQAWSVERTQYLVVLIRYPSGYANLQQVLEQKRKGLTTQVQMHVGLCSSYKPTMTEALDVFARFNGIPTPQGRDTSESHGSQKLVPLFIEMPLNSLLNERLLKIIELRYQYAFSWSGAELFFNNAQGMMIAPEDFGGDEYTLPDDRSASLPEIVQADQLSDAASPNALSFPLIAMQFTLRHFVKCTEFCLVCHCKMDANFEALKPYVCSKPLCLYQYMALGMGPSVDWEILKQPYVIDLLITFAYSSAATGNLSDFPHGLGIMVPGSSKSTYSRKGKLRLSDMQLTITSAFEDKTFLSPGRWIVMKSSPQISNDIWHFRVEDTLSWPLVCLSQPMVHGNIQHALPVSTNQESLEVNFAVYDQNFDDIKQDKDKCQAIATLLDTLPDVIAMRDFLESAPPGSREILALWNRVSSSAFDLLRWVVASNRSCIMQDGDLSQIKGVKSSPNLVSGMDGYLQFRFAQGSPDKEEKFMMAVTAKAPKIDRKYPTIFTWHGSPLSNWHGIIREGLHYKKVTNGRAYGNGVYMAQHFSTSRGYTQRGDQGSYWPNSILKVQGAISLNEVVNSTKDYVNSSSGIYVVKDIEWIQTRYLFVECQPRVDLLKDSPSYSESSIKDSSIKPNFYPQDPKHAANGPKGRTIDIPMTALGQRRRLLVTQLLQSASATVKLGENKEDVILAASSEDDDSASVATLNEDLTVLLSDSEDSESHLVSDYAGDSEAVAQTTGLEKTTKTHKSTPSTDFQPGMLTESSMTLLEPPSYATTLATKYLQQQLLQTLKVQQKNSLVELGWYIDPQLISNPYQWIVELHSFELTLPLGQDLEKTGIQSIILEMRFSQNYPMSPPFVRIVKPRLLEFAHGGGGHVTAGGALCMELLTNSGWLPSYSMESVLLSIRFALCSTEPKPARLLSGQSGGQKGRIFEYPIQDAISAYVRACTAHGWEVPKDFSTLAW
ncbi:hypothetical protein BGW36DRAFT_382663 [Talaromyces proteolyticus]|uniref:UBC core domain-containing protein n=1 Tax=Talaromyces proteolyticus TaxID=1131652 RepID=A0AAD4KN77_9EURO|nr:uncharacterized protein BGW36DRAFT_382663 [Talaromyces proteolyticus]KAH8695422.1 hypothetical protein BGW36DRAFT_382663 [Talaromyces proteolyticus]